MYPFSINPKNTNFPKYHKTMAGYLGENIGIKSNFTFNYMDFMNYFSKYKKPLQGHMWNLFGDKEDNLVGLMREFKDTYSQKNSLGFSFSSRGWLSFEEILLSIVPNKIRKELANYNKDVFNPLRCRFKPNCSKLLQ